MGRSATISDDHRAFLEAQHMFFTASAAENTRINLSPRGTDLLRVLDEKTVAYLDLTGSGNETAAHMLADGRLTMMFCSFEGRPKILRLYGRGRILHRGTPEYLEILKASFADQEPLSARQILVLEVELVQTSCGFGVPLYDFVGMRDELAQWAENKGRDGVDAYQRKRNLESMDGLPTGLDKA